MESEWVVMLVAAGVLVAGVLGSMARAAQGGAAWQDRVEASWREAAASIGATLEASPPAKLAPRRLVLRLEGRDASAAAEVNVPLDPGGPSHTRAHARFVLGKGPVFRMWERAVDEPDDTLAPHVLGDRPLARRVRVEAEHPLGAAAVFSDAACAHAEAFERALVLRSNGHVVELLWDGVELDAGALAHALGLVRELAEGGLAPLAALVSLEGSRYVPASEDGPKLVVRRDRGEVEIVAALALDGARYAAVARMQRPLAELTARIEEGAIQGDDVPPGVIEPELALELAAAGDATLTIGSERAELAWDEPPDTARAEAAVRLLGAIAGGSGRRGAFR